MTNLVPCYDPLSDQLLDLDEKTRKESFTYAIPISPSEQPYGPNSSFLEGSKFQFAYDSVSLALLQTCPFKYYLSLIEGWTHSRLPPPLGFGIYYHTCMETWHKLITHGMDKHEARLRILRLALLLGELITPGDTARTKETLARAVILYIEQFWDDKAETYVLPSGKPAVELSFTIPFHNMDGIEVFLCGHIDRVVIYHDDFFFTDYKTTKYGLDERFFSNFKPSTQMQNYNLAAQIILEAPAKGGIIDGIQLLVNHNRFQRRTVNFTPEEMEEHILDVKSWISYAHRCAEQGYWPKNPESCGKYSGCHFRKICSMPPRQREMYLRGSFVQRNWDPLKAR